MITSKIGENAGLIWNALFFFFFFTKALRKATKLKGADLNMALGWLAREGKVTFEVADEVTVALA